MSSFNGLIDSIWLMVLYSSCVFAPGENHHRATTIKSTSRLFTSQLCMPVVLMMFNFWHTNHTMRPNNGFTSCNLPHKIQSNFTSNNTIFELRRKKYEKGFKDNLKNSILKRTINRMIFAWDKFFRSFRIYIFQVWTLSLFFDYIDNIFHIF